MLIGRFGFRDPFKKQPEVGASLLQASCLSVAKPMILGCVGIACFGLIISLLAASCEQARYKLILNTFMHKLDTSCFGNLQQAWKYQVASSVIFQAT